MARVGEEFPLECPACGGDIRLIAFITEPGPIRQILTHLGEPLEPPPVSPARGPPTDWGELVQIHDDRDVFQATDRRTTRDRYPQPLAGVGRKPPKPRERRNGELGRGPRRREKNATAGGARCFGEPPPDGRNAQSRCSRAGRQPEDRRRSAIDRAILVRNSTGESSTTPLAPGRVDFRPRPGAEPKRCRNEMPPSLGRADVGVLAAGLTPEAVSRSRSISSRKIFVRALTAACRSASMPRSRLSSAVAGAGLVGCWKVTPICQHKPTRL